MARLPDDTTAGARNLGTLDRRRRITGSLSISDRAFDLDDFFKFRVASSGTEVVLALRNLQANADLRLLDAEGASITVSRRRGTRNERIARTLNAGEYFIQVSQDGVNTRYTLIASPQSALPGGGGGGTGGGTGGGGSFPNPISPSSDPGNILPNAFDTGVLSGRKAFTDTVDSGDSIDFYRFTLNQSSRVGIFTNQITGGTVTTSLIYDINGNEIVDGEDVLQTNLSINNASINKALGAGSYFVRVNLETITANSISYVLQLQQEAVTGLSPVADPPLGLGGATSLGALAGSLTLNQIVSTSDTSNPSLVGTFDSTDIYRFTLTAEASNFSALLNTSQSTGNVAIALIFDENGNGIANPGEPNEEGLIILGDFPGGAFTGSGADGSAVAINKTLGAGTYYFAVVQREVTDNTTYSLNLFANPIAGLSPIGDVISPINNQPINGNANIESAYVIGALTQNVSFKQFVGGPDRNDFYTFTLPEERNIIIRYNGSPDLAGIRFGQDRNGDGVLEFDNAIGLPPGNTGLEQETFRPSLTGDVVYSPLPPFFDGRASFDTRIGAFTTPGIATDIYARLPAGTYVVEIRRETIETDLGDGLPRYGTANILYNLSFILDP